MNEQLLSFVPKMYFPHRVFLGPRSTAFFKTLEDKKKVVVVSGAFRGLYGEELERLFGPSQEYVVQKNEPTDKDVASLERHCAGISPDYLMGFGGGSVVDLVKLVKRKLGIPLVVVPTTIGSGSEVSQHALWLEQGTKQVVSSHEMLPDVVILDPTYLALLSKDQVVCQAFDALAHGLESLVSRMAHPLSDAFALWAIDELIGGLRRIAQGEDKTDLLGDFQMAGFFAGFAQSSAATGLAHALAHCVGARYHVPHARAVAMFLVPVVRLNLAHSDSYAKLNRLRTVSDGTVLGEIEKLSRVLMLDQEKFSIPQRDVGDLVERVRKDISTLSNPYSPTKDDIELILHEHVSLPH